MPRSREIAITRFDRAVPAVCRSSCARRGTTTNSPPTLDALEVPGLPRIARDGFTIDEQRLRAA